MIKVSGIPADTVQKVVATFDAGADFSLTSGG
jgi:hypothetical protein